MKRNTYFYIENSFSPNCPCNTISSEGLELQMHSVVLRRNINILYYVEAYMYCSSP